MGRKKNPIISEEVVLEAIRLRMLGVPIAAFADDIGVPKTSLRSRVARHPEAIKIKGVKKRNRMTEERLRMRAERMETAVTMYQKGIAFSEIGSHLGVTKQRVGQIIKEAERIGIKCR